MEIETRFFGKVTVDEAKLILFERPLLGFQGSQRFALLPVPGAADSVEWLQSVTEPELGLPLLDPAKFFTDYRIEVSAAELGQIGLERLEEAIVRVVAVLRPAGETSTVNLRAPLLFNPTKRLGQQVILADERLPWQQPLLVAEGG